MKLYPVEKTILFLASVIFLVLYLFLTISNRYSADDHWYVYNVKTRGVIDAAIFVYQTWTPRPAKMLLINILTLNLSEHASLIIFGISVLVLLVVIVKKYFTVLCAKLKIDIQGYELYLFSVLFIVLFYFSCFSIDETWFWLCSSMAYLLGLTALLWGIFIFITGNGKLSNFLISFFCFVYVFGSAELLGGSVAFLMGVGLILLITKKGVSVFKTRMVMQFLLFTVLGIVMMGFIYFGVGTQFRQSLMPQVSIVNASRAEVISLGVLFLKKIPLRIPYLLIMGLPFLFLGNKIILPTINISRVVLQSTVLFITLCGLILVPSSYAMSELPPDRALTLISFLLSVYTALLLVLVGYWMKKHQSFNKFMMVLPVVTVLFLFYSFYSQYSIVSNYTKCVAERETKVLVAKQNNFSGVLVVDALPVSGMLYSDELTKDTTDHCNRFYKMYYGLEFGVKTEK